MDGLTSDHSIENLELDIADSCTCVCGWGVWVSVCVWGEGVSDINVLQQLYSYIPHSSHNLLLNYDRYYEYSNYCNLITVNFDKCSDY